MISARLTDSLASIAIKINTTYKVFGVLSIAQCTTTIID
ncbi:hypothetical protein EV13_2228 [Prochlorococcus sp. MIT 0702]|nr:hypothetical protein EV12_1542 [Prochlorococcus sp. MIT 0701]KGG27170.1 hypothetical protein EV13_2228 [Prochlorococcus sp. MIT 0702]KGG36684.1 hypothetical protein EV14_0196 [Prochlorococcus sp. MIT 0703]